MPAPYRDTPTPPTPAEIDALLERAFAEDLGDIGDITGQSVLPAAARITATMNARQDIVLAGLSVAVAAFKAQDGDCTVTLTAEDGALVKAGESFLTVSGNARAVLAAERTALNSLQHMSGIATLAHTYAAKIADLPTRLLDTRKTTPGLRVFEKYASAVGGASNHRMGLYDAVMIKDNHIAAAGSLTAAVQAAAKAGHSHIQVECDTLAQVREALSAGATSLLLDNMGPDTLRAALTLTQAHKDAGGSVTTEASSGVTLETIRALAETGVDYISVGRITQSAPAVDIGLDMQFEPH